MTNIQQKATPKKKRVLKKYLFVYGLLFVPLIYAAVFIVYINLNTVILAFQRQNESGFSVYNFQRLWFDLQNTTAWKYAIKNSFLYFPVNAFIALPISFVFAYAMHKKVPASPVFKALFFLPNVISVVALAMVFKNLFNPRFGAINRILVDVFNVSEESVPIWFSDERYAMPLTYVFSVWMGIGYTIVVLTGAMSRVPVEVEEAAAIDGVGFWRELFSIHIPLCWNNISMFFITAMMSAFTMFLHPMLLSFNAFGGTWTLAWLMVEQINSATVSNVHYAAAIGVILAITGMIAVRLVRLITDRFFKDIEY